jgi:putative ABC transport system permease protein
VSRDWPTWPGWTWPGWTWPRWTWPGSDRRRARRAAQPARPPRAVRYRRIGPATRLRVADAVGDALTMLVARPGRAVLAGLGTLLGVAWFVTALGLASTAGGQIATTVTQRLATQVRVTQATSGPEPAPFPYPPGAGRRLDALRGVRAAGVFWPVRLPVPVLVTSKPRPPAQAAPVTVLAGSPGFLRAADVRLSSGRLFGPWDQVHRIQVCVAGAAAARALGVSGAAAKPSTSPQTVYLNNMPCAVIGIARATTARPSLDHSIVLPSATAAALWGPPDQAAGAVPTILIRTRPGAAGVVARQAPEAISPARPGRYRVHVRPSPQRLRDEIIAALTRMFTVLGWVSLAIGVISIALVSWLSVRERAAEYGLRRAVGARRRHVLAHVISESAVVGLLGGLAGASLGIAMVILIARASRWVPVVSPLTVLPAPLGGVAAGILGGLGPGLLAARIPPGGGTRP